MERGGVEVVTKSIRDWTGSDLVEIIPGKVSGVPLVRGTRIPADFIVESFLQGSGVPEILEHYPSLSVEVVSGLLQFAGIKAGAVAA